MKHAREDYNRIQDPENKIPEDEPVMLFRAQDSLGADVVRFYAALLQLNGLDEMARIAYRHAEKMETWPKHKLPDL